MNTKTKKDVKKHDLQLTWNEIKQVDGFSDISSEEAEALAEFIFRISFILYKTNNDATA
jgi:hypothetical protein